MTAADRILDALSSRDAHVTGRAPRWSARCPAHEDHSPSLTITSTEGRVLVHCFAGCGTGAVMTALGLTMADLYDEPSGVRYRYTDAAGQPTRTVHRSPDKCFRQSGTTAGTTELYRLPKVAQAVAAGTTVYLVEGEQDVHTAEALGAIATTSPMGAGNWAKVDPAPLTGAHVVVVPDEDDAGRRYLADVWSTLEPIAASITVKRPVVGKDLSDHVAAGHDLDDLVPLDRPVRAAGAHQLTLTPASTIKIRPVRWLWDGRIALGTLALLAGREGIGKSTVAYAKAADVTRGRLPGVYLGEARAVVVAATEDSWAHTIVPRLMAAGADLTRVYRVDVTTSENVDSTLSLPRDVTALENAVREVGAALILLDPLMSRLDAKLDTHKDAEVRLALEPIVTIADRCEAAVLGLIHVNKSGSTDPLNLVMGSRAFAAVARSVLFVMTDPEDEATRLLGTPKNNLGRSDLPTLAFQIEGLHVADTDDGPIWTSRVKWAGERSLSIRDVLESSGDSSDVRTATSEAADWLTDYLTSVGGTDDSATIKAIGRKADHSPDALKRARTRIGAVCESHGFPRRTFWTLPFSTAPTALTTPTALTAPTAPTGSVSAVGAVGAVGGRTTEPAPTDQLWSSRPTDDDRNAA